MTTAPFLKLEMDLGVNAFLGNSSRTSVSFSKETAAHVLPLLLGCVLWSGLSSPGDQRLNSHSLSLCSEEYYISIVPGSQNTAASTLAGDSLP